MKCLLVVSVVLAVTWAQNKLSQEEIDKKIAACADQSNITQAKLQEIAKNNGTLPEEGLCFMKCCAETFGLIKNGLIDGEALELLKKEKKVSDDCNAAGGTVETCKDILKFAECFNSKTFEK